MALDIPLTVVFTDPAEAVGEIVRRIVSACVSHRRERQAYKEALAARAASGQGPR
jgi:hypothetical protein